MWFEFKVLLFLFLLGSLIAWCCPDAAFRKSALLALESNLQAVANPPQRHLITEDAAEAMRPRVDAKLPRASHPAPPRPPAAALRKRVTPYQSRKIAASQNFLCAACHKPFSETDLWEIDHVVPLHLCQGSREECNNLSNLRAIHRTCHADITSRQFTRDRS